MRIFLPLPGRARFFPLFLHFYSLLTVNISPPSPSPPHRPSISHSLSPPTTAESRGMKLDNTIDFLYWIPLLVTRNNLLKPRAEVSDSIPQRGETGDTIFYMQDYEETRCDSHRNVSVNPWSVSGGRLRLTRSRERARHTWESVISLPEARFVPLYLVCDFTCASLRACVCVCDSYIHFIFTQSHLSFNLHVSVSLYYHLCHVCVSIFNYLYMCVCVCKFMSQNKMIFA